MKISIKKLKADMAKDNFVPMMRYDLADYIKSKYGKDGCIAVWNVGEDIFCSHEKCTFYSKEGSFMYAPPYDHCFWNW